MENVNVTLTTKTAEFLSKLSEKLEDKRSTDAIVNSILIKSIVTMAKAEARLYRAKMGEVINRLSKHGVPEETLLSTQNSILKVADAFDELAVAAEAA